MHLTLYTEEKHKDQSRFIVCLHSTYVLIEGWEVRDKQKIRIKAIIANCSDYYKGIRGEAELESKT